jgi:exo-1,4-beta-D-glucosaminidase
LLSIALSYCVGSSLDTWRLQTSASVSQSGNLISQTDFVDSSWYPVTVPCTVIACLLQNNVYQDPFYGENLQSISFDYFSHHIEIPTDIFNVPWWYRTEFALPSEQGSQTVQVLFKGLNYRADVWFNGVQIGNITETVGSFRYFEFDLTHSVNWGGANALAVLVSFA